MRHDEHVKGFKGGAPDIRELTRIGEKIVLAPHEPMAKDSMTFAKAKKGPEPRGEKAERAQIALESAKEEIKYKIKDTETAIKDWVDSVLALSLIAASGLAIELAYATTLTAANAFGLGLGFIMFPAALAVPVLLYIGGLYQYLKSLRRKEKRMSK